jgi:hypothetical protein
MPININGNSLGSSTTNSGGNVINYKTIVATNIVLWLDAGRSFSLYDADYYDCGYGCQYYSSDPGCTPCYNQWNDLSPSACKGVLTNSPVFNSRDGGVIDFDGVNDYVNITNFNNKPTTQITTEAWIKPTRASVGTGTVRGGAVSSTNSMYLGIIDSVDGGSTFAMHWANQTSNSRIYNWNGSIPNNAWSYLAGTYDGSTMKAYLNGVEIYSAAQTGTIPDATYVVGTYGGALTDGVHNFNGDISVARIYNKGLSAAEVLQNFNAERGRFGI